VIDDAQRSCRDDGAGVGARAPEVPNVGWSLTRAPRRPGFRVSHRGDRAARHALFEESAKSGSDSVEGLSGTIAIVPFLSATERIIREAEAAEAKSADGRRSPQVGVAVPGTGPAPQPGDSPSEPVFAGGYADYDDLSDGITRVDLNRSALALEKLRSFDAQSPPKGEAQPPPKDEARAAIPPAEPAPTTEAPAAVAGSDQAVRRSPRVGRRLGLLIAAATAAAVAPLVGSWTGPLENSASADRGAPFLFDPPSVPSPPGGAERRAMPVVVVPPAPEAPTPPRQALVPAESPEPSAKVAIERQPAHKSNIGKRSRHRAPVTNVAKAAGPRAGASRVALPSSIARKAPPTPSDPDDTMSLAIE